MLEKATRDSHTCLSLHAIHTPPTCHPHATHTPPTHHPRAIHMPPTCHSHAIHTPPTCLPHATHTPHTTHVPSTCHSRHPHATHTPSTRHPHATHSASTHAGLHLSTHTDTTTEARPLKDHGRLRWTPYRVSTDQSLTEQPMKESTVLRSKHPRSCHSGFQQTPPSTRRVWVTWPFKAFHGLQAGLRSGLRGHFGKDLTNQWWKS